MPGYFLAMSYNACMDITAFQFWLFFGLALAFGEIILPGLVSVFLGLGALTVAGAIHYYGVENYLTQIIIWFISSTFYIFTLRLLVMKYYPTDTQKQDINEDNIFVGQVIPVIQEDIPAGEVGRISYGGTTWNVKSMDDEDIHIGDSVKILRRDNITWLVEKAKEE